MKADKNWVWAIALFRAIYGDEFMLERLRQEAIEIWNGDGI